MARFHSLLWVNNIHTIILCLYTVSSLSIHQWMDTWECLLSWWWPLGAMETELLVQSGLTLWIGRRTGGRLKEPNQSNKNRSSNISRINFLKEMQFILVEKKQQTKYLRGPVARTPGFSLGLPLSSWVSSGKLHCHFGLPFFICKIKKLNYMIYYLFQLQSLSLRHILPGMANLPEDPKISGLEEF